MQSPRSKWPKLAMAVALVGAGAALPNVAAAATQFNCPVPQIERTVTTPVAGNWTFDRNRSRLTGTRIANINGRAAMVCEYGRAGTVQAYVPDDMSCNARSGGFRCQNTRSPLPVPAPSPAPGSGEVFASGTFRLPQTAQVDLDRGRVNGRGADIWFRVNRQGRKLIVPVNDTFLSNPIGSSRGLAGCLDAQMGPRKWPLSEVPVGAYMCYETREGRIGEFHLDRLDGPANNQTMTITFTTWR